MASEMEKSSLTSAELSSKIRKSTGKRSAREVKYSSSYEPFIVPLKERNTESEVSAIDKLDDIAKDKIQALTREYTELKRKAALVSFPVKIMEDMKSGLLDTFKLLMNLETITEQSVALQEAVEAKEKEVNEMNCKVNSMPSIGQSSSTPDYIALMNKYKVNYCEEILKNVSASSTIHKTRFERIRKIVDNCTGKLKKQLGNVGIIFFGSLRNSDGKYISLPVINQLLASFMYDFEDTVQTAEREGNQQVLDLTMLAVAHVERSSLLREFIEETIQQLSEELNETKVRVERKVVQIEEDHVSSKKDSSIILLGV